MCNVHDLGFYMQDQCHRRSEVRFEHDHVQDVTCLCIDIFLCNWTQSMSLIRQYAGILTRAFCKVNVTGDVKMSGLRSVCTWFCLYCKFLRLDGLQYYFADLLFLARRCACDIWRSELKVNQCTQGRVLCINRLIIKESFVLDVTMSLDLKPGLYF